jgi:hypothetical protein
MTHHPRSRPPHRHGHSRRATPIDVGVIKRIGRLVPLRLRGNGWRCTVEIRAGWNTHVVHDGVNLPISTDQDGRQYIARVLLRLPTGELVRVSVMQNGFTVTWVQLARPDGLVIFANTY